MLMLLTNFFCITCLCILSSFLYIIDGLMEDKLLLCVSPSENRDCYYHYYAKIYFECPIYHNYLDRQA